MVFRAVFLWLPLLILTLLLPLSGLPFDPQANLPVRWNQDSRLCLGCHDGTLATNILSPDLNTILGSFRGETPKNFCLAQGHPVGIDYRLAQLNSKGRLRDPSMLDPALKLEDGQVSCISCHDPNSRLQKKLVMSNSGSRLCFSCHNL